MLQACCTAPKIRSQVHVSLECIASQAMHKPACGASARLYTCFYYMSCFLQCRQEDRRQKLREAGRRKLEEFKSAFDSSSKNLTTARYHTLISRWMATRSRWKDVAAWIGAELSLPQSRASNKLRHHAYGISELVHDLVKRFLHPTARSLQP